MEQREKLIELLYDIRRRKDLVDDDCIDDLADELLANGVVALPCLCGECKHCEIGQNDVEQWCVCTLRFDKYIDVDPTDYCPNGKRKGGDE